MACLKVTAELSSMLAGDPPHLDSLLECELCWHQGMQHQADRRLPAPPVGAIGIPLRRQMAGGHLVAKCSSPILAPTTHDGTEHFSKRLAVEHAALLHPSERTVIATGNATYKSYRLPLRVRQVAAIVWFADGHRGDIHAVLKRIKALGKKREYGYGRVHKWTVETIENDYSWFADGVLMRPLPATAISSQTLGGKKDFGACQTPYWHPDRYMEIVVPC